MGTRSLTVFQGNGLDNFEEIAVMYRHYDGYPTEHGQDLADFLKDFQVVNGYGSDTNKVANGMSCLTAQIVAHFKEGCGNIYLHPAGTRDAGEEFIYTIYEKDGKVYIKCQSQEDMNVLFDGLANEFDGESLEKTE
jgi:hypothetical protein